MWKVSRRRKDRAPGRRLATIRRKPKKHGTCSDSATPLLAHLVACFGIFQALEHVGDMLLRRLHACADSGSFRGWRHGGWSTHSPADNTFLSCAYADFWRSPARPCRSPKIWLNLRWHSMSAKSKFPPFFRFCCEIRRAGSATGRSHG